MKTGRCVIDSIQSFHETFIYFSSLSSWLKGKRFILNITTHDRHSFPHFYYTLFTLVWLHFSKTGYDVTKRTGGASHVSEQLRRSVKGSHGCWVAGCERTCYRQDVQKQTSADVWCERSRRGNNNNDDKVGGEVISIHLGLVGKWLNQTQPEQ